jgi:hypothetical protein
MRLIVLLALAFTTLSVQASWFGSNTPEYATWDTKQLRKWLKDNDIKVPKSYSQEQLQEIVKENWGSTQAWSQEQYNNAQKSFQNVKGSTFDAWDESRLREWLLEQGVVAPSGPRERLVVLAKQRYKGYSNAASSLTSSATSIIYDTSKTVGSYVAVATDQVGRKLDDSKDYVYSSWNDNQLKNWLVSKGLLKSNEKKSRDELLKLMRDSYVKSTDPFWNAWSDSYMREWLVSRGLIKTDYEKNRDALIEQMNNYYYGVSDKVWSTWSDSELKQWLVERNIIKSNAQLQREKLLRLVSGNYINSSDTFWSAWSDSDIRSWLINHGYLKSDAQASRDKLLKLINDKYTDHASRTSSYLTWPDARLRAYLRSHGLSEDDLPNSRPGLLQEVRIRYVQSANSAQTLFNNIREVLNSGVEAAEEKISQILELLSGSYDNVKGDAEDIKDEGYEKGKENFDKVKGKTEL